MRSIKALFILLSIAGITSCGSGDRMSKKKIQENKINYGGGEQVPVDNTDANTKVRLQVSFYSIGAGIDYADQEKYVGWLQNHDPKVKYDEAHWGREGEIDYCFALSELNKKEQEKFVADTKAMLAKSNLVHIDENIPCAHKK